MHSPSDWRSRAQAAVDAKTKPLGALGQIEALAVQLAELQQTLTISVDPVRTVVFAADHGVSLAGVSAYPRSVTAEMLRNFAANGAAVNAFARAIGSSVEIVDVGVDAEPEVLALTGIVRASVGRGCGAIHAEPAMSEAQLAQAMAAGAAAVDRARASGCRLMCLGEMGIGNTTSAAALGAALCGAAAGQLVGPGTGLNATRIEHKRAIVEQALARHRRDFTLDEGPQAARQALASLGGFEIAALAGAMLAAGRLGVAVLVDGFIVSAAALAAVRIDPAIAPALFYAHRSAEPGHQLLLQALAARPLLDLQLRLGEGTGALLAVPLLRAACAMLNDMASFDSAGVSHAL